MYTKADAVQISGKLWDTQYTFFQVQKSEFVSFYISMVNYSKNEKKRRVSESVYNIYYIYYLNKGLYYP